MLSALKRISQKVTGHVWSTLPVLRPNRAAWIEDRSRWVTFRPVNERGELGTMKGLFTRPPGAKELVVIVPGLGADAESAYCQELSADLYQQSRASLRLNLSFFSNEPPDFRRDSFDRDLTACLEASEFEDFDTIVLLGFSLGGHAVLKASTSLSTHRISALVLINTPIDLSAIQKHMDAPAQRIYRSFFLSLIRSQFQEFASEGLCLPYSDNLDDIRTLRGFDEALMALREDYRDLDARYQELSARSTLTELSIPCLFLAATNDPIIPFETLSVVQSSKYPSIDFRTIPGGHIYGPRSASIGELEDASLIEEIIHWVDSVAMKASQTEESP